MTALVLASLLTVAPAAPQNVYALDKAAFIESAKGDLEVLHKFVDGMSGVVTRMEANKQLFVGRASVYSPEEKTTLIGAWGSLFAFFSATEGLRQKYWDFVKLAPTDPRHAWGFVVTHTALTALLSHGLRFAALALGNKQLETIFDEENAEYGVPQHAFANFKLKAIHVATSTQLVTGDTWAATVIPLVKKLKLVDTKDMSWAFEEMKRDSTTAKNELAKSGVKLFAGNAKDIAKDSTAQAIFPVQKSFAEWAGDTRVARIGKPLITAEQIEKTIIPKLQPGDVLVARQNWFLSNIALPGFWPHALLYSGTATDLAKAFDADAEVVAWAKAQPEKASSLSDLLAKRYPSKWKTFVAGIDFQGHSPIRVIESISEGVSFTSSEHAFGVDYLGAMRPRLPTVEKAKAIERAFFYQGRPYDFNFDFFSDSSLVCTELVFKAYQPAATQKGIALPLVDVAGRKTLPANEIVKRYDVELANKAPQFDFVLFMDAKEKAGVAVDADEAAFRTSWNRVKWDIAQQ